MLTSFLAAGLVSTATALALPNPLSQRATTYTTNATYYQGISSSDACGQTAVSTDNITSEICNTAYTYALSVQPVSNRDCVYTLWTGSSDCGSDATEKSNAFLPAGGHGVCVTTGVYDGGAHIHASGMLNCDIDIN